MVVIKREDIDQGIILTVIIMLLLLYCSTENTPMIVGLGKVCVML